MMSNWKSQLLFGLFESERGSFKRILLLLMLYGVVSASLFLGPTFFLSHVW